MRLLTLSPVALLALFACGDDGGSTPPVDSASGTDAQDIDGGSAVDAPSGTFTLTSTAYTNGGVIPITHVCTRDGGANTSPPLAWENPPVGTMSFAIVFTDKTPTDFLHSAIYDIPMTATELPADVDKVYAPPDVPDAHQTFGYNGSTRGYLGPCPGNMHTYEFAIYALPTATLTGATMTTSLSAATAMIKANNLGVAKLTGTHTPP